MNLAEAIEADPLLRGYDRKVDTATVEEIRVLMNGFAALFGTLDLRYEELNLYELACLAVHRPQRVSLVQLAFAREDILSKSDEPGQAEQRAVVTIEWLRSRLEVGATN